MQEAIKVPCEPNIASSKTMDCKVTVLSLDSASCETKIVLDHKMTSASRRVKPRLSRKAKAKALCANNEASTAPLTSSTLLGNARTTACDSSEALCSQIASLCEANSALYRAASPIIRG